MFFSRAHSNTKFIMYSSSPSIPLAVQSVLANIIASSFRSEIPLALVAGVSFAGTTVVYRTSLSGYQLTSVEYAITPITLGTKATYMKVIHAVLGVHLKYL